MERPQSRIGQYLSRTSDYDEKAVEYLKRGLANIETSDVRESQSVSAAVTLAFALLHLGRNDEAIDVAEKGLEWAARSSDRAKLLHLMGIGFALSNQAERAILLMTEAKQIDPTDQALAANLQKLNLVDKRNAVSASELVLPPKTIREVDVLLRQLAA